MYQFLEISKKFYYANIFLFFTSLLCAFYCYKNNNTNSHTKYLFVYPLSSTCIQLCSFIFFISLDNYERFFKIEIGLEKIFLVIEYFILSNYYYRELNSKKIKIFISRLSILYSLTFLYFIILKKIYNTHNNEIYLIQALFVLTVTIIAFLEILKIDTNTIITKTSIFWIISGSLVYFLCTLPIYFSDNFIFRKSGFVDEKLIYSINYLCYCIFFLLITKATTCKPIENQ